MTSTIPTTATASETETPVILPYSLPKLDDSVYTGSLYVYGSANITTGTTTHLLLFCAGYPDNHTAFEPLGQRFATENEEESSSFLVGITCLAGYDDSIPLAAYPAQGYTFDEWTIALKEAVKTLRKYHSSLISTTTTASGNPHHHQQQPPLSKATTLTCVFHDWAVVPGNIYVNQTLQDDDDSLLQDIRPDRMVIFDVLLPPTKTALRQLLLNKKEEGTGSVVQHKTTTSSSSSSIPPHRTLYQNLSLVTYQGFLAITFVLNRYTPLYLITLPFVMGTSFLLQLFRMFPIGDADVTYFQQHILSRRTTNGTTTWTDRLRRLWYMCFPYYHFWYTMVFRDKPYRKSLVQSMMLPSTTQIPILYLYGTCKSYDLGNGPAMAILQHEFQQGRPSRVIPIHHAGHWLYRQQETACYQAMIDFFHATTTTSTTTTTPKTDTTTKN
jgi:hypothetical protein